MLSAAPHSIKETLDELVELEMSYVRHMRTV